MIDFSKIKTSKKEMELIAKIVDRVINKVREEEVQMPIPRASLMMDLTVVHHKYSLRLNDMLEGGDFDFFHDIYGIIKHLDRETGELKDCFLPRYAR